MDRLCTLADNASIPCACKPRSYYNVFTMNYHSHSASEGRQRPAKRTCTLSELVIALPNSARPVNRIGHLIIHLREYEYAQKEVVYESMSHIISNYAILRYVLSRLLIRNTLKKSIRQSKCPLHVSTGRCQTRIAYYHTILIRSIILHIINEMEQRRTQIFYILSIIGLKYAEIIRVDNRYCQSLAK